MYNEGHTFKVYCLTSFDKYVHLGDHHHSRDSEHIHHPSNSGSPSNPSLFIPQCPGNHPSAFGH